MLNEPTRHFSPPPRFGLWRASSLPPPILDIPGIDFDLLQTDTRPVVHLFIRSDILLSRLVRDRLTSSPLSRYPSSKSGAALGHGQETPLSLSITCKSPRSIYNLNYYR